jgi:nicotinamidase-related amidase
VFGVVTEYCVQLAARGLLERGRRVALVSDAVETLRKEEGQKTTSELTMKGARLTSTDKAIEEISAISKN